MKKSILEVVHESAQGMHKAGVMDDMTMREFDALCLPPIKQYTPAQIKKIRTRNHVSQSVLAAYLNTSKYTVQKWESGQKKPSGPSLKLLNIVEKKGIEALAL